MKHKERKTWEAFVVVRVTCDICGYDGKDGDWKENTYDVRETQVSLRTGTSYPDGGSGVEYEVDLCPKCFAERLIPWLESQGAAVRKTEWDC